MPPRHFSQADALRLKQERDKYHRKINAQTNQIQQLKRDLEFLAECFIARRHSNGTWLNQHEKRAVAQELDLTNKYVGVKWDRIKNGCFAVVKAEFTIDRAVKRAIKQLKLQQAAASQDNDDAKALEDAGDGDQDETATHSGQDEGTGDQDEVMEDAKDIEIENGSSAVPQCVGNDGTQIKIEED